MHAAIRALGLTLALCPILAACSGSGPAQSSDGKYAGLEAAILDWRGEIRRTDASCPGKPGGEGCQSFEVGCKGERPLGPEDAGKTAKLVVAMSWEAWVPGRDEYQPRSAVAEFSRSQGIWSKRPLSGPVNLSTCAVS